MNTIDNERIQTLVRMLEVNRSLGGVLDLEPYLLTIIAAVTELTGSEVASILEPDEGGKELRFSALPWFHRDALKAVRVPLAGSIAGWVYENAKPLNVPDAAADPRHFKAPDQAAEFQTRSMLAVPLIFKGQTLGVLEAANKTNNAHYTEEDLTILETLASSAAIAIQISRLASQAQRALEEIANLDRMKSDFIAIASHELRTPLGLILGHATFLREIIAGDYRAQLDIIIRNAMRLKEIIESIADIDNVQRGLTSVRRKPFSITSLIAEVLDTFDEEARKRA